MKTLVEQEDAHDDPKLDEGDKIIKLKDWSRTMENFRRHFWTPGDDEGSFELCDSRECCHP